MFEIIVGALEETGICQDIKPERMVDDDYDVNLQEYITDSMSFISFIIILEEKLGIELPDDLLLYDSIRSMKAFALQLSERTSIV